VELLPLQDVVIATGGGTFADPENRAAMMATGAVAWLDLPLEAVISRIPPDGRRPLAADRAQLELLFLQREQCYREAHVRIDGSRPPDEVVERLLEWLGY
jgi:shikimate kinase